MKRNNRRLASGVDAAATRFPQRAQTHRRSPVAQHRSGSTLQRLRASLAFWQGIPRTQPPTVRLCMVEVAEAIPSNIPGKPAWLSDFVCFRLFPLAHPHVFRKSLHVVPRDGRHDLADYVIGLRLFHEAENA